jgi:CHAT domain-containing protein
VNAQFEFDHARQLFVRGDLEASQQEAERGYERFQERDPKWASEFLLLKAQSLLQRGMYDDALRTLRARNFEADSPDALVRSLTIESIALLRQQQPALAEQKLAQASDLCQAATLTSCGEVLQARGILAGRNEYFQQARELFLAAHLFAEAHHDGYLDASALLNLGWTALQVDHFDEALDWLTIATRKSAEIGAEDLKEKCSGNLGWAYHQLGDDERALQQFLDAEQIAERAGNLRNRMRWLSTAGYVYQDSGDLSRAMDCYRKAFLFAKQLDSKEDIESALEDLAQLSVMNGKLNDAAAYIDQAVPMESADRGKLSPDLMLTKGMLAAALDRDQEAEADYRSVWNNRDSLTKLRLTAGSELATLVESQRRPRAAEQMYKSTLAVYESTRATLRKEEEQLPFGANATEIYDDYIRLLVGQGRTGDALAIADRSRARTLEQGLDADAGISSLRSANINPPRIAQAADATLLFYWLGEKQSYLWTITPARVTMSLLPPREQIAAHVKSYSNAILNLQDPRTDGNQDGLWLYHALVAPARAWLQPRKPVVILDDGALSELNFETLLVPGSGSVNDNQTNATAHYLIEDFPLVSAPSLAIFGVRKSTRDRGAKMLLLGDPVSPSQDYPSLPLFAYEMTKIESHFGNSQLTVVAGDQATPAAYLASHPAQYSYIHFVSHAVASKNDPLDSAIVLSRSGADENSFKLYAREIVKERIDARLVTISACYGSGTRSYAGEGLVGLSWAFLRAGAHRVIGALWEVSDTSTPRLMDSFYANLASGNSPEASLRAAKLDLIHSRSRFSLPFYWAVFQMYDRE